MGSISGAQGQAEEKHSEAYSVSNACSYIQQAEYKASISTISGRLTTLHVTLFYSEKTPDACICTLKSDFFIRSP